MSAFVSGGYNQSTSNSRDLIRRSPFISSTRETRCVLYIGVFFILMATNGRSVLAADFITSHQMSPNPNKHPACTNFTIGLEQKRLFFSPNWPGKYPQNINCTRVITAPPGQVIQLDFRESFHLEPSSDCRHDYLQIRNGREAYSPELIKSCGHNFPRSIRSNGRHLWLRFRSDESIEYTGFKAVYDFVETDDSIHPPHCTFNLAGSQSIISTENITSESILYAESHSVALDCKWRIAVSSGREIKIAFNKFTLAKPNECDVNFVEILHGPELSLTSKKKYCSSKADSVKLGVDQEVTFRYYAKPHVARSPDTRILAVVTELRPRDTDVSCSVDTEFDCDDLYCINSSLVCNGFFNCDKQLDEKPDRCDLSGQDSNLQFLATDSNIIILTIGCALLTGMCCSMVWNCMRKLREDRVEKEESLRRSQNIVDGSNALPTPRCRSSAAADNSIAGGVSDHGCYVPSGSLSIKPGLLSAQQLSGRQLPTSCEQLVTVERGCQTPRLLLRHSAMDFHSMSTSSSSTIPDSPTPPTPPPPPPPPHNQRHGDRPRSQTMTSGDVPEAVINCPLHVTSYTCCQPLSPPAPSSAYGGGQFVSSPNVNLPTPLQDDTRALPHPDAVSTRPRTIDRSWRPNGSRCVPIQSSPARYRTETAITVTSRPNSMCGTKSAPDVIVKL